MPRHVRIFRIQAIWEEPGSCTSREDGSPRRVIAESKIEILVESIR
jgi:hypothetical protein